MRNSIGPLVWAAAVTVSSAALAQSPAAMLEQIGLLGRWSNDCEQAAATKNDLYYYTFERVGGGTGAQLRMGSVVRMIDNVRRPASDRVTFRLLSPGPDEKLSSDQVIQFEGNRYRTISSVTLDGQAFIRNGANVKTGRETIWSYRCP